MKGQEYRLLIVEDNPDTRKLISYQLASVFDLTIVENYDAAVLCVEIETFDIFILDINLGEENKTGIKLLATLRTFPHARHTPAIALTAYALPGDRERFIAEGFDDYLSKPFSRAEIISIVVKNVSEPL